ncbi:extra spindle pole bodies like 1, separase [Oratosquilla oratoria]|uniref:extra spindle pole bodies like 1, separase n=1 Tax=Oratosquilla oratoria TaxID=337810 RepID=UPI003F763B7B
MANNFEENLEKLLSRLGARTLEDVVNTLPSARNAESYIRAAEKKLQTGNVEEAFHYLSLSHSTLLHHRISMRVHKPRNGQESSSGFTSENKKQHLVAYSKDDTLNMLRQLPSDWTVVQITSHQTPFPQQKTSRQTPGLYLARCRCGPTPSIIVKSIKPPSDEGVRSILTELEIIKKENGLLFRDYKDDVKKYWSLREEHNDRLKSLVRSMEVAWLKHWRCLLCGSLGAREEHELKKITSKIMQEAGVNLSKDKQLLLQCVMTCPIPPAKCNHLPWTVDSSLRAGVANILEESVRSQVVKDLTTAIGKYEEQLAHMRQVTRNPAILIIDKAVLYLPWEMTTPLREQPVSRLPSLRMLSLLYQHHANKADSILIQGVDIRKGFYVLNPGNDLPKTQERLQGVLKEKKWEGILQRQPTHNEFKEALSHKDVFVYIGHGSGSKYLPGELLEALNCRSLTLLFGCSSVHLTERGEIPDPWGVVLNYLIASCPCVVGMLWDVTDKEVDRITEAILRFLEGQEVPDYKPSEHPTSNIPLLVAQARNVARHYLMACAPIVYGLPLHTLAN